MKFGMRRQGNEALSYLLHFWICPFRRGLGENWFSNPAYSLEVLSEYTGRRHWNNMERFGACSDVNLCSAWTLAPGRRRTGCVPLFWQRTQKRLLLPSYPSDSNQSFVRGIRAIRPCSILNPPPYNGWGAFNPQIRHCPEKTLSYTTKLNALKLIWRLLEHV